MTLPLPVFEEGGIGAYKVLLFPISSKPTSQQQPRQNTHCKQTDREGHIPRIELDFLAVESAFDGSAKEGECQRAWDRAEQRCQQKAG